MTDQSDWQRFAERYVSGQIPWDEELPPPELIALAGRLEPGRALDLGSGYGRSAIYLARLGWQVDGVDFVPRAVEEARSRAREAGTDSRVQFHVGDVTKLDFLQGLYDLAVDIGCMHILKMPELEDYRDELKRLLRSGARLLLFAHLRDPEDTSEAAVRWIEDKVIRELLADGFTLDVVDYGFTQVADNPPWPSAWFRFRRS
jgi:SAM-dependent methyltransferase